MVWTSGAQERMERVPAVLRSMVVSRVDSYARAQGSEEVTADLVREARQRVTGGR